MRYEKIEEGIFLERPNRFVARVRMDGREELVHVRNTGRCRELLVPGETKVYLEDCLGQGSRRTRYSLVAVRKGARLINMDSQAPNRVAAQWLKEGGLGPLSYLAAERTFGHSRFDFYYEREKGGAGFLEVKGVTLEEDGVVRFPDAPTERGVKHLEELVQVKKEGLQAGILFVIQMEGVRYFTPNWETHPAFGEALLRARLCGVEILAYDCSVTKDSLVLRRPVPIFLDREQK